MCSNCVTEYFVSNGQCSKCAKGCAVCDNSTTCKKCADGYFEDPKKPGYCLACSEGCIECSGANTCTKCSFLYELKKAKCEPLNIIGQLFTSMTLLIIICICCPLCGLCMCCLIVYFAGRRNSGNTRYSEMQN